MTGPIVLTGEDLTVSDVWAVAVDRVSASLAEPSRDRMEAARALVERRGAELHRQTTHVLQGRDVELSKLGDGGAALAGVDPGVE